MRQLFCHSKQNHVNNTIKILPNLKVLERKALNTWWEDYQTLKSAGNIQPRNSYFTPQMNYYINNLLYDSSKDLDHWKSWDDAVWIVRMRDRLPLNHQTRDHVAD